MGCSNEFKQNYWISYKHILTNSDLDKIEKEKYVCLISNKSIPNFIHIIENSNIMKYKNNSDNRTFNIIKNKLIEYFENYKLEKKIKIYNDYKECKNLAEGKDEKMNEFIIVDESFLDLMKIKKDKNIFVLIKLDKNKDKQIIIFPDEKLHLGFEEKSIKIENFKFKFIDVKDIKDFRISYKNNEKNLEIKKRLKYNSQKNQNEIYEHKLKNNINIDIINEQKINENNKKKNDFINNINIINPPNNMNFSSNINNNNNIISDNFIKNIQMHNRDN